MPRSRGGLIREYNPAAWRGDEHHVTEQVLADGDLQQLYRLRYGGSASYWGFAIYLASKDGY